MTATTATAPPSDSPLYDRSRPLLQLRLMKRQRIPWHRNVQL